MTYSATYSQAAQRTFRESAYVLSDLPVGVIGFSVVTAAVAAGASLAITLAGVPILVAALLLARWAGGLERKRARALLDLSLAPPPPRERGGDSSMARLLSPLRDRASWRAAGYFLLMLPAGVLTFSAAVAWWATSLFLLTFPAWAQIGDTHGWSSPGELAAASATGLVMLAATPFAIHAITHVDRALLRLIGAR